MSYRDVMEMPLRSFWSFNGNVARLRAEEGLTQIDLFTLGNQFASSEMIEQLRASFVATMKEPIQAELPKKSDAEIHKEGLAKLRGIAAQLKP